jgi:hypothetical protein
MYYYSTLPLQLSMHLLNHITFYTYLHKLLDTELHQPDPYSLYILKFTHQTEHELTLYTKARLRFEHTLKLPTWLCIMQSRSRGGHGKKYPHILSISTTVDSVWLHTHILSLRKGFQDSVAKQFMENLYVPLFKNFVCLLHVTYRFMNTLCIYLQFT